MVSCLRCSIATVKVVFAHWVLYTNMVTVKRMCTENDTALYLKDNYIGWKVTTILIIMYLYHTFENHLLTFY